MECAVAFLTVEAVFPAVILYIAKYARVALSTLLHCQRLGLRAVKLRIRRYLHLHFSATLSGKGHCGHNAKGQYYCCKDMKLSYFHCTFLLLKNWLPGLRPVTTDTDGCKTHKVIFSEQD
jgi:hypothetical protein